MSEPLFSQICRYYAPVVKLTALGEKMLNSGKPRRGRLMSVRIEDGHLRVRKFGQKTINSYAPDFWEFAEQVDEREGME